MFSITASLRKYPRSARMVAGMHSYQGWPAAFFKKLPFLPLTVGGICPDFPKTAFHSSFYWRFWRTYGISAGIKRGAYWEAGVAASWASVLFSEHCSLLLREAAYCWMAAPCCLNSCVPFQLNFKWVLIILRPPCASALPPHAPDSRHEQEEEGWPQVGRCLDLLHYCL